ncbi:MAG: hypothetical protein SGBAC_004322 [Bacillariaceae sp.]
MTRQYDKVWAGHIKELKKFKETFGHCNVRRTQTEFITLSYWIRRVRGLYKLRQSGKRTTLTDERIKELEDLGFGWEGWSANRADIFQTRIEELKDFSRQHGHCRLPASYPENLPLKSWVNATRQKYRQQREGGRCTLTPKQIKELESVGFEWNLLEAKREETWNKNLLSVDTWNKHMNTLREFKETNGHCQVPSEYPENPSFGSWASQLRQECNGWEHGEETQLLLSENIAELRDVGFLPWRDDNFQPIQELVVSMPAELPNQNHPQKEDQEEDAAVPLASKSSPFSCLASLAEICRVVSQEEEKTHNSSPPQKVRNQKNKPKRKSKEGYGHWTNAEHQAFLAGLDKFGRKWTKIASSIPSRSTSQVRSHAQKYFDKLLNTRDHHHHHHYKDWSNADVPSLMESHYY